MNRRQLLFAGLSSATLASLFPSKSWGLSLADEMLAVGPVFTDNDGDPLAEGGRADFAPDLQMRPASMNLKYWTFEQVVPYLSLYLESKFDMFFFVNTDTKGGSEDFVPFQHIKVVRRTKAGAALFERNERGIVTGLTPEAEIWDEIPISSGKGSPYLLTYSGIFRFNHIESRKRIGTNESPEAHMSYSMYIDYVYNSGREARVAIHGTPSRNHHLLGKARASEGCMRVLPSTARTIRNLLLSPQMWSEDLPAFVRTSQLPTPEVMKGQAPLRPGVKALVVIFNGFSNSLQET